MFSYSSHLKIAIVGLGALGSFTTYFLAKHPTLNITFHLIDFDVVEKKNIYNQIYGEQDVGAYKVDVMRNIVEKIGKKAIAHNVKVCEKTLPSLRESLKGVNLIVGATDNLHSRNLINTLSLSLSVPWIYAAISPEKMMICLCISNRDKENYNYIFSKKKDVKRYGERVFIPIEVVSLFSSILSYRVVEIISKQPSRGGGLEFYIFEGGEVKKEVVRWGR